MDVLRNNPVIRPFRGLENGVGLALQSAYATLGNKAVSGPLTIQIMWFDNLARAASVMALAFSGALAQAALDAAVVKTDQARAELLAHAPEGIAAGKPLWLGLKLEHQPHWHSYWTNPGDSGLPTTLSFTLPAGFVVGDIQWPTPKPLPVGPLMNFGYEGTLLLAVPITVPAGFNAERLDVQLRADWLICKDVCIPEGGDFRLSVASQAATGLHAKLFNASQALLPRSVEGASAEAVIRDGALVVSARGLPADWQGRALSFLPELAGVIDNAARPAAQWRDGVWQATVPLSPQRSESPSRMHALLLAPGQAQGLRVDLAINGPWPAPGTVPQAGATAPAAAPASSPATPSNLTLWAALALAFGGGMLLNLMPCVFPVLSLKVMGFAGHAHERRALFTGGLAYCAGVVLSFLALAALLLALRSAGEQVGWGFQLQSPGFVALLAALFTLIGLNLVGVFDVGTLLPSSMAAARARHPTLDSALTGVLAVAVASPCTAPFMGASLGLAATLPTAQALSVFGALGLGMAAPYVLASAWPGFAQLLPRPGAWMATFKTLLAFPMFATVIWLLWVLGQQVGIDGVTALLGALLALTLLVWSLGSQQLQGSSRWVTSALAALCLAATLAWALPALRQEAAAVASPTASAASAGDWQPWSAERVQTLTAQGRPVFVDFTAA